MNETIKKILMALTKPDNEGQLPISARRGFFKSIYEAAEYSPNLINEFLSSVQEQINTICLEIENKKREIDIDNEEISKLGRGREDALKIAGLQHHISFMIEDIEHLNSELSTLELAKSNIHVVYRAAQKQKAEKLRSQKEAAYLAKMEELKAAYLELEIISEYTGDVTEWLSAPAFSYDEITKVKRTLFEGLIQ
jgi:hypothetical protein